MTATRWPMVATKVMATNRVLILRLWWTWLNYCDCLSCGRHSLSTLWPLLSWFIFVIFCGHHCYGRHCLWPSLYRLVLSGISEDHPCKSGLVGCPFRSQSPVILILIGVRAPLTRAKPLFFGQKLNFSGSTQQAKMEKYIFLYLLNEKTEFIPSS